MQTVRGSTVYAIVSPVPNIQDMFINSCYISEFQNAPAHKMFCQNS